MKRTTLVLLIVVLCGSVFAQKDFRNTNWGMNSVEVVTSEKNKPKVMQTGSEYNPEMIVYEVSVAGLDAGCIYIFYDSMLVRTRYVFIEKHSNRNDYISDYNTIKKTLTKKYGEPTEEKVYWSNDLYQDDRSNWGFAVSLGHLYFYATWKLEKTNISIVLKGDNYKITHICEYTSVELGYIEDEAKERKNSSDF